MKKIILSLLVLATLLVSLPQMIADTTGKGNLVVHFKKWDSEYTNLRTHSWGGLDHKLQADGTDGFGVYFQYNNLDVVAATDTGTFGFIAVKANADGSEDWNNKYTGDINIPKTVVKADKTVHVYVFQGNNQNGNADNPRYFVADPEKYNMLLVYFDPSGAYEENIGVHNWGGWTNQATTWNEPLKVFSTGGNTEAGVAVKVAMLQADPVGGKAPDAGLLVYFGDGDNSKKTGDVKLLPSLGYEATTENKVGDVGVSYVYNKGNGITDGSNVFYTNAKYAQFYDAAFSFKLQPFGIDSNTGQLTGTYAVKPTQIIVKTSAQVTNLVAAAETQAEKDAALATMTKWFKVREIGTTVDLEIERVDFALRNATVADFVVVLKDSAKLDITKKYEILYNDATNETSLKINMDIEKPVLLISADDIILVKWGQPFNLADFPLFSATDDRDGDLTRKVFVPKGANSVLDTSVEGDYVIMLEVEDNWGNVTQETFTFRVTKNPTA